MPFCLLPIHKVAASIQRAVSVPFLHLLEATALQLRIGGIKKAGLIGTKFTMTDGFYQETMTNHGIEIITPKNACQDEIHRIIFDELCKGVLTIKAKNYYQCVIDELKEQGAMAVIFGCTEIGLLLNAYDSSLPVFDSISIHIKQVVDWYIR